MASLGAACSSSAKVSRVVMGDNDISEIERTDRGQKNVDKREARRLYKEKKTPLGIFVLRCRAAGESWVSASNHLCC